MTTKNETLIVSPQDLRKATKNGAEVEVRLSLGGGLHSTHWFSFEGGKFYGLSEVDGETSAYTPEELLKDPVYGPAMRGRRLKALA